MRESGKPHSPSKTEISKGTPAVLSKFWELALLEAGITLNVHRKQLLWDRL